MESGNIPESWFHRYERFARTPSGRVASQMPWGTAALRPEACHGLFHRLIAFWSAKVPVRALGSKAIRNGSKPGAPSRLRATACRAATQTLHLANAVVAMIPPILIEMPTVQSFKRSLVDWLSARCWLLGFSLYIVILGSSTLHGQDTWQGPTTDSSWFTQGNWSLQAPPTNTEAAVIDNGTTAQVTETDEGTATADTLTVGATTAGSTVQFLPGGILEVTNSVVIGPGGTLRFSGGELGIINTRQLENNGVILFDGPAPEFLGGDVSGTGKLIINMAGALEVSGNETYSGETLIMSGIFEAESATALSRSSAFTVNGTLDLGGFDGTIGSLSGPGIVLNNGAKISTLSVGQDNTSTTFSGILENGTSVLQLTKIGTGTLTLTGANTYTGTTTVDAGSLIVDGSIASPQTVVNAAGLIGGHGTIGGSLVNNGVVGQAISPGTLTVTGNYTQGAGGSLRIGVAGLAPGQHDLLAVNGHAALGGTLQFIRLGNFNIQPGDQITFLTAKNGVSGTFSNVQNGLLGTGTIVQVQVTSLANSVVLEGTQGSFADTPGVATTPNNRAVAKALDSARGDPREAALFAFLNSQPLADLPHDLTLIAPTAVTSINATAVSVGKVQISNIGQRLENVRGGSNGFSSSGFSINGGAVSFSDGLPGVSGPEGKGGTPVFAPTPDNRWGVFLTGLGEFTDVSNTPDAAGYDVDTGGFTFGVDYRVTPNIAVGLTAGYAHTSVNPTGGGRIDVNGGKLGAYATIFGNGFYLDTAATGGPSGYNTHRAALQGSANGSTDGADFNALVAGGYDWKRGNLSIGPTASFQYSYTGLDSFTETGSLAPLKFPDQNTESERTAFGAKASYEWKVGQIVLIPQVSLAWQHEFGDTAYSIVSGFATGAGNNFTVTGPEIGRDSLLIGAGATVIWNDRVSTYLYYDGEVARTNYESHNVSGGVRITF
jgi:autotransporter-associated beta strand protein